MNKYSSGIYNITIDNKIYIGSAVNIKQRWRSHQSQLKNSKHPNIHLQRAWNKYKEASFTIICNCPIPCLLGMEQYWIDMLKPAYNIRKIANSNLGLKLSSETKAKISAANQNVSDERRAKISAANMGHIVSEETRIKISTANMNHSVSTETRNKQSNSKKGRTYSDEHKLKISIGLTGRLLSNSHKANLSRIMSSETKTKISLARKGKPLSEEHKLKISLARKNQLNRDKSNEKTD